MRRTATAASLLLAAALAAPLAPAPARAQGTEPGARPPDRWVPAVAVYRGSEANVPPAVPVLRGSSAAASGVAAAPSSAPAAPADGAVAVGGNPFWRYDAGAGELVACRLGPTTQVGRDRVRCSRASLPP